MRYGRAVFSPLPTHCATYFSTRFARRRGTATIASQGARFCVPVPRKKIIQSIKQRPLSGISLTRRQESCNTPRIWCSIFYFFVLHLCEYLPSYIGGCEKRRRVEKVHLHQADRHAAGLARPGRGCYHRRDGRSRVQQPRRHELGGEEGTRQSLRRWIVGVGCAPRLSEQPTHIVRI